AAATRLSTLSLHDALPILVLFDGANGSPLALMDAASITAIRTAAVSAVATRVLAKSITGTLAILGSGVQARTHVRAMLAVRRFRSEEHTSELQSRFDLVCR